MALPICLEIPPTRDPMAMTLPGGVEIEDVDLMKMIQPALAPLSPMFQLIDAVVAVFTCVKAIPDALGPPPDPTVLAACLPDLARKVNKLLALVPQLALPRIIVRALSLAIETLRTVRAQLVHLQAQLRQIDRVVDRARALKDPALMAIAQCAQANVAQEAANVGKGLASLGRLLAMIGMFMGIVGGPAVPDLASLHGQPLDEVVPAIDALIRALVAARSAVPGDLA